MIQLCDKETGSIIGEISNEQLQFLADHLEEETTEDQEYYITRDTLEMLQDEGMDTGLLQMLGRALGIREDMEVQWLRI
jgi:hypothetical protein